MRSNHATFLIEVPVPSLDKVGGGRGFLCFHSGVLRPLLVCSLSLSPFFFFYLLFLYLLLSFFLSLKSIFIRLQVVGPNKAGVKRRLTSSIFPLSFFSPYPPHTRWESVVQIHHTRNASVPHQTRGEDTKRGSL